MNLNRRNFLLSGAAAVLAPMAARAAVSDGTPCAAKPVALDGPLAVADSPLLKTVKFASCEIAVGAKEPFKALHCSDTHLNFMNVADLIGARVVNDLQMYEGRRTQHNPLARFAACVLKARLGDMPLLHTGDVWDYHCQANYEQAKSAFDAAGDVFYAIGNHEIRGHWKTAPGQDDEKVRREMAPYLPNDSRYAARVLHGVNFLAFDNANGTKQLVDEQLAFFKHEFAKCLPVVLMCHLPFSQPDLDNDIVTGEGPLKAYYELRRRTRGSVKLPQKKDLPGHVWGIRCDEARLRDWLLAQPNLKAILCGHLHAAGQYRLTDTVTEYIAGAAKLGEATEISFI